jgi:hypothetical protein
MTGSIQKNLALLEHVKLLYNYGLYDDVKLLSDLLIGIIESSSYSSSPSSNFDDKADIKPTTSST